MIDYDTDEPDPLTKIEALLVIAVYAASACAAALVVWSIWSMLT